MTSRSKYAVHFFTEGEGFVVRGTLDPQEALALAVADEGFDDRYLGWRGACCSVVAS